MERALGAFKATISRSATMVTAFFIGTLGVSPELSAAFVAAGIAFASVGVDVLIATAAARFLGSGPDNS